MGLKGTVAARSRDAATYATALPELTHPAAILSEVEHQSQHNWAVDLSSTLHQAFHKHL